jgi:hypothetical protein
MLSFVLKIKTFRSIGVFALLFTLITLFRPYQLVSKVGWLDPWLNMGMGQVFPRTSYSWNYYKESRIFSILYQYLLTHSSSQFYLVFQTFTISLFGYLFYSFLMNFTSRQILALGFAILAVLNPLLWGDSAGGADYYNLLGNLFVLSGLYLLLKILTKSNQTFTTFLPMLALGMFSYLISIEVPSGIIVVFIIQCGLLFGLINQSRVPKSNVLRPLIRIYSQQILGVFVLLLIESVLLIALGQSPNRLLSGPKFLLHSILDASVQENWWRKLGYVDLVSKEYLQSFIVYGLLSFLLILYKNVLKARINHFESIQRNFIDPITISFFGTWIILVILQLTGKSVALTLDYFTTPFLVVGFAVTCMHIFFFLDNLQYFSWALIALPLVFFLYPLNVPTQFVLALAFLSTLIVSKYSVTNSRFLTTVTISLVIVLGVGGLAMNKDKLVSVRDVQFKICEKERLEFRNLALTYATKIDRDWGPRGSNLMSASPEIFELEINSNCSEIHGRPLTDALLSFSQLGFPGVSLLGPIAKSPVTPSYPYEFFAEPYNRVSKPSACLINLQVRKDEAEKHTLSLTFFGNQIYGVLWCPSE